ncbi:unnamed protein product [Durusdinium trenchii]|uniref:EF-hand domain-containing protein n=1 Tax=Durusdinium trenchii TaxID=1381693 RepID=A0ABP0SZP6_9DINO
MPPPGQCCAVGAADEDVLRSKIRVDLATANRETQQFVQELISQQNIKMQKQIQALSDLVQEYITQVKQGGLSLAKKAPEEDVLRPMCSADFTMHGRMSMMPRLDFNDSHHLARMEKASNTNPFRTFKTQKKTLKTKDIAKMTTLQQWVHSKCFQILTVCAIFGNILAMGVEVDFDVSGALVTPAQPIPEAFAILNYIFLGIFGFEVIIKLAAFRGEFFRGDDHAWNLFDAFLVITQAAEILLESFSVGGMRAIRILRLVRTLRVIRLFHFFRELRMMVVCIFNSLMSLIWAVTLLITVTYVFAILCAQGAATWLREPSPADPTIVVISAGVAELAGAYQTDLLTADGLRQQLNVHFQSLLRTMLSLMMSVTGGCDWYQIAKPLMNMSYFYFAAFLFYVLLIVLCIMNVLSALFVEMALQIKDRDLLIQAELAKIDAFLKDMRDLFDEVDVDGNGYVTRIELSQYMKNERVMAYFGGQGLDMSDVGLMFDLLDSSHDGTIGLPEFLLGTLRLKGGARCIEVMRLFQALDHIRKELGTVQQKLHIVAALGTEKVWVTLDAERPREGLEPLLQRCDGLFCSARFPQSWTGKAGLPGALASLLRDAAQRASFVVATRGERGSLLMVRKSFVGDKCNLGAEELASLGVPVVCCAGSFDEFYTLACDVRGAQPEAWPLPASFKA